MDCLEEWDEIDEFIVGETSEDGVFVKGGLKYIITDDLHVMALDSSSVLIPLFDKLGINDAAMLDERNLDLGVEEVINVGIHRSVAICFLIHDDFPFFWSSSFFFLFLLIMHVLYYRTPLLSWIFFLT